jgi:hypothetical protein
MFQLTEFEEEILLTLMRDQDPAKVAESLKIRKGRVFLCLSKLRRRLDVSNNLELLVKVAIHHPFYLNSGPRVVVSKNDLLTVLSFPDALSPRYSIDTLHNKLFRETSYFKRHKDIDEFTIERYLLDCPWLITLWEKWQMDRNKDNRWRIEEIGLNCYTVYGDFYEEQYSRTYNSITKAYAVFIKNELERIRCTEIFSLV